MTGGVLQTMNVHTVLDRKNIHQLFSYFVVGGIATVVEWIFFYIFSGTLRIHYLPAAAFAFAISTGVNWAAGRLLTFRHAEKQKILQELGKIYAVSIVGLLLNLLLMYLFVEKADIAKMAAKIMATILVFAWNFTSRKIWIYKNAIAG